MNCELSKYLLKSFNCKNVTGGGSFNPPSSQSEGHHKAEAFSPAGAQAIKRKKTSVCDLNRIFPSKRPLLNLW